MFLKVTPEELTRVAVTSYYAIRNHAKHDSPPEERGKPTYLSLDPKDAPYFWDYMMRVCANLSKDPAGDMFLKSIDRDGLEAALRSEGGIRIDKDRILPVDSCFFTTRRQRRIMFSACLKAYGEIMGAKSLNKKGE